MARSSLEDLKSRKFWAALFAEMLGTGLLVLVACGSTVTIGYPRTTAEVPLLLLTY